MKLRFGFKLRLRLALTLALALTFTLTFAQGIPFIRNYPATEYHAHNQNFDIISGTDGTVYVANFEGLLYYDQAEWHIIHTPGITRITAVFCDSKGTIWTGGYNYLGRLENDAKGRLQLHTIDDRNVIKGDVQWIWEKAGNIYFLVGDHGIYTVRDEHVVLASGEQLPTTGFTVLKTNSSITQVQELDYGMKAIATNGEGIIVTDANGRELFRITEKNGLCSDNVAHITYNKHGMIWGATDHGVFAVGFPSIYTHFTQFEGLNGEVCAIEKIGGQIYAGTMSGLFRLKGKQFVPVPEITHACWQLTRQNNSVLAATSDGVFRIGDDHSVKHLTTANTLSVLGDAHGFYSGEMDSVYYNSAAGRKQVCNIEKAVKMMRDSKGNLWTQNLYGMVWKNFKPYTVSHDSNTVTTLVPYEGNVLPVTAHTTKPFSYPYSACTDSEGLLWLTNNKGKVLYAFRNGAVEEQMSAVVYPLMDYPVRTVLRDSSLLWIGGDKGINVVSYSHENPSKTVKPHLYIRSIRTYGDSVLWGGYGQLPEELPTLPDDNRQITINYSTAHQSLLLKTQYRHRLNNGNWTAWEYETSEEYPNLPYGSYVFEVQARDAFGQLSDIVAVRFTINTPFYLRWYMNIFYLLLVAAIVYVLFQLRLRRLEKDKHRLESLVKERTTEVVRLEKMATVGKLTNGLIDRILNPLNYINNFAKLSEGLVKDVTANVEDEEENMDKENYADTMEVLDMLKGNLQKIGEHGASTSRTLKAMEEMLKDRSGGLVPMNLTSLLHQNEEMLRQYFAKEIAERHITVSFNLPDNDVKVNGNPELLSKSIMSLLGNAVYALVKKAQREQYQPAVKLTLRQDDKHAYVLIQDNGIGIEQAIIHKIFDPFFTTKTTGEADGIGLYLSRETIQNHGGDISVTSEKNIRTEFVITLPIIA